MSKKTVWTTVNEALDPGQRKELNVILLGIKCTASSMLYFTQGQESRERNMALSLKLLTDEIPHLLGAEKPQTNESRVSEPEGEPLESEIEAFRREALCELKETGDSYKECGAHLGITPERAELEYTDMVQARIESLAESHPYGFEEPSLELLVKHALNTNPNGKLSGRSKFKVMWPFSEWPYPYDAECEASRFMADVISALTIQLPFHTRESIRKRRHERLFSALQRFPQHDNQGSSSLTPDQRELAIRKSGGLCGRRPGYRGSERGNSQDSRHSSEGPSSKG